MEYVIAFQKNCYGQETPTLWMSSWKNMNYTSLTQNLPILAPYSPVPMQNKKLQR